MSTFSKNLVNEWTPELILKRIFRNTDTCDDMYSMPRENKFGIAKEETETVGKKRRMTVLRMRSECSSQMGPSVDARRRLCIRHWDAQLHRIVYQEDKRLCRFTVSVGILDLAACLSEAWRWSQSNLGIDVCVQGRPGPAPRDVAHSMYVSSRWWTGAADPQTEDGRVSPFAGILFHPLIIERFPRLSWLLVDLCVCTFNNKFWL